MKIGILGSGNMTRALAGKWLASGHEVLVSGRDPGKAAAMAAELGEGATSGSFSDAAAFGDVLLIAIMNDGVMDAIDAAGDGAFDGKTLVDCCNPVDIETFMTVGNENDSLAERIQARAAGARVVKAFNLCQVAVWEMQPPEFDGRPLVVPYCSDDAAAGTVGAALIADTGCVPMNIGPLSQSRNLEAMACIVIKRLFSGAPPLSVFNWIGPTDSPG